MGILPPLFRPAQQPRTLFTITRYSGRPSSTSKTRSKPSRRRAATTLPLRPLGAYGIQETLTQLGADKRERLAATTCLEGLLMAIQTFRVSSRSSARRWGRRRCTGRQLMQVVSAKRQGGADVGIEAAPKTPMTPTCWFLRQTATQRRQ